MAAGNAGGSLLILSVVFFAFSLKEFYDSAKTHALLHKIEDIPDSSAESAAVGLVKLNGAAQRSVGLIASPIRGAPCVYWKVVIEVFEISKSGGYWEYLCEEDSDSWFKLHDGTGSIGVDPSGAKADIPEKLSYEGTISEKIGVGPFSREAMQLAPLPLAYVKEKCGDGIKKKLSMFQKNMLKVKEYWIEEGESMFVLGDAEPTDDGLFIINKDTLFISDTDEGTLVSELDKSFRSLMTKGLLLLGASLLLFIIVFL